MKTCLIVALILYQIPVYAKEYSIKKISPKIDTKLNTFKHTLNSVIHSDLFNELFKSIMPLFTSQFLTKNFIRHCINENEVGTNKMLTAYIFQNNAGKLSPIQEIGFIDSRKDVHEFSLSDTPPNPDDYLRFEYNASDSFKVISLTGNIYSDLENHSYKGSLRLAPWSSILLIKMDADRTITSPTITSVVASADSICTNTTTILTAIGVNGTDSVVTWWTESGGTGTYLGTGLTISAGPGTYYARVTGYVDSAAEASVTVNPISVTHRDTTVRACKSFTWNGTVYTSSGNYIYSGTNTAGCYSTDTLHLTITNGTSSQNTVESCHNYTWNGNLYTVSGDYVYTTVNAAGCDSVAVLHLTINPITIELAVSSPVCQGMASGSVKVTAKGGKGPYLYKLGESGAYQPLDYFTGLQAGTYNIYIQDAHGCVSVGNAIIPFSPTLPVSYTTMNPTCHGTATGSIKAAATGGKGPYLYRLGTRGAYRTSGYFPRLKSGSYNIYIKDATGCISLSNPIVLSDPRLLTASFITENPRCYGAATGSIKVNASGGKRPYLFRLQKNGIYQSSDFFTGLKAGSYKVYVQDSNGCTIIASVNIQKSKRVTAEFTIKNASSNGASDGTIAILGSGGSGNFEYQLGDNGMTQASGYFMGLKAGRYKVNVKDKGGCEGVSIKINIAQPTGASDIGNRPAIEADEGGSLVFAVNLYPNPTATTFQVLVHSKATELTPVRVNTPEIVEVRVKDINGRLVYRTTVLSEQAFSFGETLISGLYFVEVRQGKYKKTVKAIKK